MKILLLKAFREEDFAHELQHKFKLETQLKTLTHNVDEKTKVGIKDAIKIVSSLNTPQ